MEMSSLIPEPVQVIDSFEIEELKRALETEKIKNAKPLQSYLPFNKQGGIVSNLTKKEIDKLIKQGFIIEEID